MQPELIAGRYRVERAIGRGGMGTVWLCVDETLRRQVAVKQIGALPGESAETAARALREARTAAALNHRNAVSIYDVVNHEDKPWLVMEYMPSRTLSEILDDDGALQPAQVANIGAQLAAALTSAHSLGIIHRDIKPSNVLIGPDGVAKITDFGIARGDMDDRVTQTGMVTGTPGYFSPEMARGGDPTKASDVWALGATLFAAVEGHPPYQSEANPLALLAKIANSPIPKTTQAGPLTDVLTAMMEPDPDVRWTMPQALAGLRRVAERTRTEVASDDHTTLATPLPPVPPTLEEARHGDPKAGIAAGIGAAGGAAAAAAAAAASGRPATSGEPPSAMSAWFEGEESSGSPYDAAPAASSGDSPPPQGHADAPVGFGGGPYVSSHGGSGDGSYDSGGYGGSGGSGGGPFDGDGYDDESYPDESRRRRSALPWIIGSLVALLLLLGGVLLWNDLRPTGDDNAADPPKTQSTTSSAPTTKPKPKPSPTRTTRSRAPKTTSAPPTTTQPTTTAPTTTAPTTTAPTTTAPTTPPVTTDQAPAASGSAADFVIDYYNTVPGNLDAGWSMLSPSYQASTGRSNFDNFWGSIAAVDVSNVRTVGASTVQFQIVYTRDNGSTSTEQRSVTLERSGDSYRIDGYF